MDYIKLLRDGFAAEKEFRIEQREDDEPQDEEVEILECDWAD